jgi:hypothetical protein
MDVPFPRAASRRLISFLTFQISMFFSASLGCSFFPDDMVAAVLSMGGRGVGGVERFSCSARGKNKRRSCRLAAGGGWRASMRPLTTAGALAV